MDTDASPTHDPNPPDHIDAILALISTACDDYGAGQGDPLWKARNLLRDSLERRSELAAFDIEQPITPDGARSRIFDAWPESIFNGGYGFPEGGAVALWRDAAAMASECDRLRKALRRERAR